MLNIYRTDERVLNKLTDFRDGVWVQMVDPTSNELSRVAEQYEIELDDLATAMDDEESSRISLEDGYTLILVDIPSPEVRHEKKMYTTIPLGIILKQKTFNYNTCVYHKHVFEIIVNRYDEYHWKSHNIYCTA